MDMVVVMMMMMMITHFRKLQAGKYADRILVKARFSAPVQTSPGAHLASYTMGTERISRG
jgi:hypothetical protein